MAIKSKVKLKAKTKAKATSKSKAVVKTKVAKKLISKPRVKAKPSKKTILKANVKAKPTRKLMTPLKSIKEKSINTPVAKPQVIVAAPVAVKVKSVIAKAAVVKRIINPMVPRRPIKRSQRANQFTYMKAPGIEHDFEVSDTVEVFCDHEKNRERIRGWVKGIVVQVDHKMAAVQFRSNVYLTDGWMVPDRILWYPVNSEHIRAVAGKKIAKKDFIPDY
jgi:hypothetical protein